MRFTLSEEGLDFIKSFEGYEEKAYKDSAGVWTIGWGSTKGVKPGMIINESQATDMLRRDVKEAEDAVNRLVEVEISQPMFDALVSFAYNCGIGNLSSSTLLRLVNESDFEGAAEQFPRWNRSGGKILNGLIRRRDREREMFLKGF